MLTVTEVLGRSEQGMTRPFICKTEDGRLWYVKGKYAGQRSLCCEWVAGCLAERMALPIPEFAIVNVPKSLVAGSDRPDIRHLGEGPAFASLKLPDAREITWSESEELNGLERSLIVLFDCWVQNEDRSLSSFGGNPNLLITDHRSSDGGEPYTFNGRKIWTYDFNLAFDRVFDAARFWENHIFAKVYDLARMLELFEPMRLLREEVPEIFRQIPQEWLYIDGDESLPAQLEETQVVEVLQRAFIDPERFWRKL